MHSFKKLFVLAVALFLMLSSNTVLGMVPPPAAHLFLFSEEGIEEGELPVFAKSVYEVYRGQNRLLSSSTTNEVRNRANIQIDLEIEPLKKEAQETYLLLLVDSSWSMTNKCEDGRELNESCRSKMEAAQEGLLTFLDSLEQINLRRTSSTKIRVALLRYDTMIGYYNGEWKETYNNPNWVEEINFTSQVSSLRQQVEKITEDRIADRKCHQTAMGWGLSEGLRLFNNKVKNNSAKKVILNFTDGRQGKENIFYIANPSPGNESACYLNQNNPQYACTENWDFKRYLENPSRNPHYDCDTNHPPANSLELIEALKSDNIKLYNVGYGEDADGSPPRESSSLTSIHPIYNCPSSVCPGSIDGRGGDRSAVFEVRERSGIQYSLVKTDLPLPGVKFNLLNGLSFETGGMYYYIPQGSENIESIFRQILEALSGTGGIKVVESFSPSLLTFNSVEAFAGGVQVVPDSVNENNGQLEIVFPEDTIFENLNLKIYFSIKDSALGSGCVDCAGSKIQWFASQEGRLEENSLPQYNLLVSPGISGQGDIYLESQDIPLRADLVVLSANSSFHYPQGSLALLRDYDFEEESYSASQRFQKEVSGILEYFLSEQPTGIKVVDSLDGLTLRSGRLYILDSRSSPGREYILSSDLASAVCEKTFGVLVWGGNLNLSSDISCARGVFIVLPYGDIGGTIKVQSPVNLLGAFIAKKIEGNVEIQGRDKEAYWRDIPGLSPLLEKIYLYYPPSE
ncbi:VWA domain-containing protein [bacterium]|nr:VWA domain-containing protein [bacterium]